MANKMGGTGEHGGVYGCRVWTRLVFLRGKSRDIKLHYLIGYGVQIPSMFVLWCLLYV